ncbi:AraC family transcriptional regulator N-terminal domain-containing protein [Bilophila wadsworthia]|uniref:AraC family transcriptional regulator n=1 Tax=Bilophila wadsworthia TaxID=35833 RepID=UPI003AAC5836
MTDCTRKEVMIINAKLKEILLRHMDRPGVYPSAIRGVTLVRREAVNNSERCFEKPLASIIVQGSKHSTIGTQEYDIRENQCLVSGVDMPSASYTINSASEKPFLSLFFYLDREILTDLIMEMEPDSRPPFMGGQGVSVADAEPEFLEGVLRLTELLDKPKQIPIRAPLIMRELHYLLLIGPQGGILQGLYTHGSQNNQVIQAISLLRRNIASPLRVDDLARHVNMSVSSLHRHFKSVTGFSPLQYHKQLRLYEAQRLMLMENERAASAALSVGYESVTQFNREYKRMFGEPPHRDINRRRGCSL